MRFYNKEEAISRINRFSKENDPFIFIIDYLQNNSIVEKICDIDCDTILFDFNGFSNSANRPDNLSDNKPELISHPLSFEEYEKSFHIVKNNILSGNSFLTNLTCRTPIEINMSMKDIFFRSKALYKLWIKDSFVVFSPEIFVRIENNMISSFPMKGTIHAEITDAEKTLMNDRKEAAEHATIVDLIRNDLSIIADDVHVSRYRYVDRLNTSRGEILQTSSEVNGILPDEVWEKPGDIIFSLLPAGSITGAPKCKTMNIISQAEDFERGFYTGVMGYYDGGKIDSAVMIRFIEQENGQLFFKSGGGITCNSDAQSEYNEIIQKIYVPVY